MKNTINNKVIWLLAIFVISLLVTMFNPISLEGFLNPMNPGEFPQTQDKLILHDVFKMKENPNVGTNLYSQNERLYPRSKMTSFEHRTNNQQFWNTPDNGKCSPAEMCGTFYS